MKAGKLFQLAFSVILIACTTGCYDKDEVLEADNYQSKKSNILLKKKEMASAPMMWNVHLPLQEIIHLPQ
ncbi:hypothetical protein [Bacteroides rodentium]|uniref:hypothetical protein n=1 Tax=Bacteroides rodentium TaxID=691816 RepID=UPI000A56CE50|nr:hypothetical protein [Bacteroides rodentium]